jgi:hypothetical protein
LYFDGKCGLVNADAQELPCAPPMSARARCLPLRRWGVVARERGLGGPAKGRKPGVGEHFWHEALPSVAIAAAECNLQHCSHIADRICLFHKNIDFSPTYTVAEVHFAIVILSDHCSLQVDFLLEYDTIA